MPYYLIKTRHIYISEAYPTLNLYNLTFNFSVVKTKKKIETDVN